MSSPIYNWTKHTIINDAKTGDIEHLKYAYKNNCLWIDENLYRYIIKYGQLECLKYIHGLGYNWDKRAYQIAKKYNQLDCLNYLEENSSLKRKVIISISGYVNSLKFITRKKNKYSYIVGDLESPSIVNLLI